MTEDEDIGKQGRNWAFTLNNYTTEEVEFLKSYGFKYIIFGYEEAPTTGTPHLQGYFQLLKKQKIEFIKKNINKRMRLATAKGNLEQNKIYCRKTNPVTGEHANVFFEKGDGSESKGQGDRCEIKNKIEEIKNDCLDIYDETYVKNHRGLDILQNRFKIEKNFNLAKNYFENEFKELNENQKVWEELLLNQNRRQILWIVDYKGNIGKSFFSDYLLFKLNGKLMMNGPTRDLAFAYNYENIVMFDYVRSMEGTLNYEIIEMLKNGRLVSNKYESCNKIFPPCKIICFSNFMPDLTKLSEDRWQILEYNLN
nr:MAG: replication associated protein [Cressdnaviricota sp.]